MSKCERCHKEFESTRKDKKFCSELCRKRAEKARYQKRNRSPRGQPKRAAVDHIVPLSLGGAHSLENVQLAHLFCNMRKGNRYGDGKAAEADCDQEIAGDCTG